MKIRLAGPGGAGKSTVGVLLAELLGVCFIDLDVSFVARHGDVGRCIETFGYRAYAQRNVDVYLEYLTEREEGGWVMALSSGFMTYPADVHPAYEACCRDILGSPTSFVLLPSLEPEACIRETVRRQLQRPFARSAERESQVIRERLPRYRSLPLTKIETMAEPGAIALDIRSRINFSIT